MTERPDFELNLGGATYALRASYERVCKLEEAWDAPLMAIAGRLADSQFRTSQLVDFILTMAVEPMDRHFLENEVMRTGMFHVIPQVVDFLNDALSGGETESAIADDGEGPRASDEADAGGIAEADDASSLTEELAANTDEFDDEELDGDRP